MPAWEGGGDMRRSASQDTWRPGRPFVRRETRRKGARMHFPSVHTVRFTVFLFVLFPVATAASAGTISGRVVDPDDRPVASARVLLSGGGMPLHTATTLDDGRFSMDAPETGRLAIRIAAEGFRAEAITV